MRINRPRRGVLDVAAASPDDYPDAVSGDAMQPDYETGSEHGDAAAGVKCARDSTESDLTALPVTRVRACVLHRSEVGVRRTKTML